jgi:hypothetical protein
MRIDFNNGNSDFNMSSGSGRGDSGCVVCVGNSNCGSNGGVSGSGCPYSDTAAVAAVVVLVFDVVLLFMVVVVIVVVVVALLVMQQL